MRVQMIRLKHPAPQLTTQQKRNIWLRLMQEAKQTGDGLGKKIDRGVRPVVVALWAHGIATCGSCEGHLDHGIKAPWIEIGKEVPRTILEQRKESPQSPGNIETLFQLNPDLKRWRAMNLKSARQVMQLLDEFYRNRSVRIFDHLILARAGIYGVTRLQPQGTDIQEVMPRRTQARNLEAYRQELQAFGLFLRTKYMA